MFQDPLGLAVQQVAQGQVVLREVRAARGLRVQVAPLVLLVQADLVGHQALQGQGEQGLLGLQARLEVQGLLVLQDPADPLGQRVRAELQAPVGRVDLLVQMLLVRAGQVDLVARRAAQGGLAQVDHPAQ